MKHLFFTMLCGLGFACGGNDGREYSDELQMEFSMDTVVINPRDEILFLNFGLYHSQLSADKKYLYNFNHTEFSIEKINLDELVFEDKTMISKEGPNGVGQQFEGFLFLNEDTIYLKCVNQDNVLDKNGKKQRQFELKKVGEPANRLTEMESLEMPVVFCEQPNVYFGLVSNWQESIPRLSNFP